MEKINNELASLPSDPGEDLENWITYCGEDGGLVF
jgi:hypothetical protein